MHSYTLISVCEAGGTASTLSLAPTLRPEIPAFCGSHNENYGTLGCDTLYF
jgi:hypothetical protein